MKATFFVSVGGNDVTGNFSPISTDISVTDASGESADVATISVADDNGEVGLPNIGDPISIGLGFGSPTVIFDGFVDDVDSAGSRGAGRTLSISAKSADTVKGKAKEQAEKHEDDTTLGDVFSKWAKAAGIGDVRVHASLASIERPYWSMNNESFIAWGQRMARSYGATFKILGDRAVLVPRSAGVSASGGLLLPVLATYGDNLISWNIKPLLGRPQHAEFRTRHFDVLEGDWKETRRPATYATEAAAIMTSRFTEVDEGAGGARSGSNEKETDRERGGGTVEIIGNPQAQAEATCIVRGARPGVDGAYRIDSATHKYNRSGGFNTSLTLKQPKDGAGTDGR